MLDRIQFAGGSMDQSRGGAPVLRGLIPAPVAGGWVLGEPVQTSGTLTNLIVVAQDLGAVARRLTEVFGNVLKLPVDAIRIFSPGTESQDKSPPGRNSN